jgi:hypothetical protein
VNGNYVLTFKSGLNEYNSTLDLTAGSRPSIVIVNQGSNWFDALVGIRIWIGNNQALIYFGFIAIVVVIALIFLLISWFDDKFMRRYNIVVGLVLASIYMSRKEGQIKTYDTSSGRAFENAKKLYSEMSSKVKEWAGRRDFLSRVVDNSVARSGFIKRALEKKAYKRILTGDYKHFQDFGGVSFDKVQIVVGRLDREFNIFGKSVTLEDLEGYIKKVFDEIYEEQEKEKS